MPRAIETVREAAAAYAARGIPVLPLYGIKNGKCTCGRDCGRNAGKHPHTGLVPTGLKDASTDPEQVGRWFRAYPEGELNIGIVLRELVVIDEDTNGAIIQAGLDLPNGPVSKTGRGYHYLFKLNGQALLNGTFAPGLDCKTGEAYTVAPPSMHVSGRPYQWVGGHSLDDVELTPLPESVERLILAAHGNGSDNGAAKDDLHDLFGTLKLEEVFLAIEKLAPDSGDQWRQLMLRAIRSLIGRGWRDDAILMLCRRATRRDLGFTHEQTDTFVVDEIRRTRRRDKTPEPEEDTFDQVDGAQESDPWPEPIDIIGAPELVGWPELNSECLPQPLYRYVEAEAERLNVDPCPLAVHVLAACATLSSDAWRVKPKRHDRWTQQPRIWACVVKDIGARGTDMLRSAFWPVRQREDEFRQKWQCEMAAWTERQAERKKGVKTEDPKPICRRITTQDATIEAASQILANGDKHSKLTLRCDELVAFLGAFGRYSEKGSAARGLWLEGYDGGPQHIDRIIRGNVFVPNWSIVVAGNIQPRRLAGMARDLIDDGLFQRFVTIHTKPAPLGVDDDVPLNQNAGREYRDLLETLADLVPPTGADGELAAAYFDDDARDVRRRFTPLIERLLVDPTLPTIIRETAPKWSGLLARLSLIFHLAQLAERARIGETLEPRELCRVTGPTVTAAAQFLRRIALPNLFRLGFETLPEDGAPVAHARWIAGHVLAHGLERVIARDIGRAHRPLRGKPLEIEQAMEILCDAGWACRMEGRHDSQQWQINRSCRGSGGNSRRRRRFQRPC